MCYLNVCPFIKPVGKNCVVEKRDDQCCPTIMCPQGKFDRNMKFFSKYPVTSIYAARKDKSGREYKPFPLRAMLVFSTFEKLANFCNKVRLVLIRFSDNGLCYCGTDWNLNFPFEGSWRKFKWSFRQLSSLFAPQSNINWGGYGKPCTAKVTIMQIEHGPCPCVSWFFFGCLEFFLGVAKIMAGSVFFWAGNTGHDKLFGKTKNWVAWLLQVNRQLTQTGVNAQNWGFLKKQIVFAVPVELWTSTTLPPTTTSLPQIEGEVGESDQDGQGENEDENGLVTIGQGCDIGGEMYMDGMQVKTKSLYCILYVHKAIYLNWLLF